MDICSELKSHWPSQDDPELDDEDKCCLLLGQRAALEIERLRDALRLILPMAKGYAHQNPVGSNQDYVSQAEACCRPTASCGDCGNETMETQTMNEDNGNAAVAGRHECVVMRYREGYYNEWPTVMLGDKPIDDFVGELNKLASEIERLRIAHEKGAEANVVAALVSAKKSEVMLDGEKYEIKVTPVVEANCLHPNCECLDYCEAKDPYGKPIPKITDA